MPGLRQTIQPCFGYQNGVFNLVVNENLTPENAFRKLSYNMAAGKFLYEKTNSLWGRQQLIVFAKTDENRDIKQQISAMKPMLRDNHVDLYDDPNEMTEKINREAKELTDVLRQYTVQTSNNAA